MFPSDKKSILDAIAEEESRLAGLEGEAEKARERLRALRSKLETVVCEPHVPYTLPLATNIPAPTTSGEKIDLFRSLFRGRDDIFPRLWTNLASGKKGYAPACSNEWVPGICEKPRVRCGDCPNQAFIPVANQVIRDHLQGKQVIGVYPLLKDETCRLLAVDFDKGSWMEDVLAFIEACHAHDLPAAVERSRSGNGAHVWFFFADPVAATVARKMGCYLITEAMARRHQLSMKSYDRLFPNQDTMPRGGFGSLIALPLQHGPRQKGNTVFLDDRMQPYADQWAYLASIQRLDPRRVESIAEEATRSGRVIDVPMSLSDDMSDKSPWMRPPSGHPRRTLIADPLPKQVRAALAQRLFIEKAGLPPPILNEIKRLAAFQNPEFYKKQSMRLSTAMTPRVICCAEELSDHIALPRGCLDELKDLLKFAGSLLALEDRRVAGESLDCHFQGNLTPVQEQAARALLQHDIGLFVAPPGIGKTVVGTFLIAARHRSSQLWSRYRRRVPPHSGILIRTGPSGNQSSVCRGTYSHTVPS